MQSYYVNKNPQSAGEHEIHKATCKRLPDVSNRLYLGNFSSCEDALKAAKKFFSRIDGCAYCCKDCHKK